MTFESSPLLHWPCRSSRLAIFLLSIALLLPSISANLDNDTSPTHIFRSRPDLHAPVIDLIILRPELVEPGYIFIAPYRNRDPGPYIYDNYGNLVWSGAGESGPKVAHAPQTCEYMGEQHLCFFQGEQHQGFARGHGTILNKNYRVVKTIDSSGAGASSDMHEFRMTPHSHGRSVLNTVYQPRHFDLTVNPLYKIKSGMGWIVEGVFQEVDIESGKVLFEWRSADHLDPSLSFTYPSTTDTSGDGLHEDTPWDYFHINSIDKNTDGDYLISARHMHAIYKISGVDGHIIWEMGGMNPTFHQTNFNFSSQHHARWVTENATHTELSFFDNGSNEYNVTDKFSHGYVISIDHVNSTATMIRSWGAPEADGGISASSQGNMQILPGGNVHIGWGEYAYFTEHTQDGSPVMYGQLAKRESNVMVYRSGKFNWTGEPVTKPALWTYALAKDAPGMAFYASWNGATEIHSWNFYTAESASGPFKLAMNKEKTGFETSILLAGVADWAFAEALDKNGRPLERSVISKTFVPSDSLRPYCNEWACGRAEKDEEFDESKFDAENFKNQALSSSRGYNTKQYYAVLPSEGKGRRHHGKIELDVGSLVLGLAVAAISGAVMTAFMFQSRHKLLVSMGSILQGVQPLGEQVQWRASQAKASFKRSKLGKYARVNDEEEEKSGA